MPCLVRGELGVTFGAGGCQGFAHGGVFVESLGGTVLPNVGIRTLQTSRFSDPAQSPPSLPLSSRSPCSL
eukprot:2580203-Rhodomonas_salina.1